MKTNLSEYFIVRNPLNGISGYDFKDWDNTPEWLLRAVVDNLTSYYMIEWTWDIIHSVCVDIDYNEEDISNLYKKKAFHLGEDPKYLYYWASQFCETPIFKNEILWAEDVFGDRDDPYCQPTTTISYIRDLIAKHIRHTIIDAYIDHHKVPEVIKGYRK